jgi:ABC-type sugar transport system ATPase subunit
MRQLWQTLCQYRRKVGTWAADHPQQNTQMKAKTTGSLAVAILALSTVLVISSKFEELLAMSDRLLIIHDGKLIKEMSRQEIGSEEVLHHVIQG